MNDNYTKTANVGSMQQPKEPELRFFDALYALESQQNTIFGLVIDINLRLSGEEPVEEVGIDARSYEERLNRLLRYNNGIIEKLTKFSERF